MTKCPFCGQEINNPEIYYENRKKIVENGRSALKRIDKIKEQNQMLIENERNKESRIYVRKKLDTKQRGKEKETVYSMIQKMKKLVKKKIFSATYQTTISLPIFMVNTTYNKSI